MYGDFAAWREPLEAGNSDDGRHGAIFSDFLAKTGPSVLS
jgi:hypothetical protein